MNVFKDSQLVNGKESLKSNSSGVNTQVLSTLWNYTPISPLLSSQGSLGSFISSQRPLKVYKWVGSQFLHLQLRHLLLPHSMLQLGMLFEYSDIVSQSEDRKPNSSHHFPTDSFSLVSLSVSSRVSWSLKMESGFIFHSLSAPLNHNFKKGLCDAVKYISCYF